MHFTTQAGVQSQVKERRMPAAATVAPSKYCWIGNRNLEVNMHFHTIHLNLLSFPNWLLKIIVRHENNYIKYQAVPGNSAGVLQGHQGTIPEETGC